MNINLQTHREFGYKGHRRQYDPYERPGIPNTIELRAKAVDQVPGAKHLFVVYTNDQGQQFYLACYPDEHELFDWDSIVMKGGEYTRQSPDWKPYIRLASLSGDPQSVYQAYLDLKDQFQQIDAAEIPYGPRQNSNSAAMTVFNNVLRTRNLEFDLQGDVWAPGSSNDLNRFLQRNRSQQVSLSKRNKSTADSVSGNKVLADRPPRNHEPTVAFANHSQKAKNISIERNEWHSLPAQQAQVQPPSPPSKAAISSNHQENRYQAIGSTKIDVLRGPINDFESIPQQMKDDPNDWPPQVTQNNPNIDQSSENSALNSIDQATINAALLFNQYPDNPELAVQMLYETDDTFREVIDGGTEEQAKIILNDAQLLLAQYEQSLAQSPQQVALEI